MKITPPRQDYQYAETIKKPRSSNLELYRIICMLMIVAHHYVVNSGLMNFESPMYTEPFEVRSIYLWLFGMWGKTGINCFVLITGFFMCESKISLRKFLKILLQVYFYQILIYPILLFTGYESFSLGRVVRLLMPFSRIGNNFTGCFIIFYLTIPFWTILIHNINRRQHELLILLLLGCYTVLGSMPSFGLTFNYISWFGILFLIASYIRRYDIPFFNNRRLWGIMTLCSVLVAMISVILSQKLFNSAGAGYIWVIDSNKILALVVALCSFLWFKNLNIKYSKMINNFGAGTFGVLLIHANSDAMRIWLWKDTVDVVGHYGMPLVELVSFSIGVVITIFVVCNIIDQLRIATIEKWFFKWYDRMFSAKAEALVKKITQV